MGAAIGSMFGSSGSISAKAVEATKAETQKLISAAKSGGFRISEEAVKPLLDSISTMQHELTALMRGTSRLSQTPKLGSHEYGQTVAEHDQKAATSEAGSAIVVLEQFRQVLVQATEALQRAAGIYRENEESAQSSIRNFQV
ncbi:hypothetical protein [Amycolatopsis arida]|nr:hypothetical protein [Amycolatopsis arida]